MSKKVDKIYRELMLNHLKAWNKHCTMLKKNLEPYFRKQGKMLPVNFRSFYIWYRNRHKEWNEFDMPLPDEKDFMRYHEYMAFELDKAGSEDSEKDKLKREDIYKRYWEYRNDRLYTVDAAYGEVENWLLVDLRFTRLEIKERFNITLKKDAFTRSARNQRG